MSLPIDENRNAPSRIARERAAREKLDARRRSGTVRQEPLPALLSVVLVKQRVEVRTKRCVGGRNERVGVVEQVNLLGEDLLLNEKPIAWDSRGFWTCDPKAAATWLTREQIERITVLEGPIPVPLEDRGSQVPTEEKRDGTTNYQLESYWIGKKVRGCRRTSW